MSEPKSNRSLTDVPAVKLTQAQEVLNEFSAAVKRANTEKPSKGDRAELDRLLQEFPSLWSIAGDLMEQAAQKLIHNMESTYSIEATLKTAWHELPKQLTRSSDGTLERLLVKQVVLCWLQLGYVEHHYNHYLTTGSTAIRQADFWERRLSAAQRRYPGLRSVTSTPQALTHKPG
jgi:hypothetical protein